MHIHKYKHKLKINKKTTTHDLFLPPQKRKIMPVNEGIVDDHYRLNCVMKCLCHSL